jgi:TolB-like protein
MIRWTDLYRQLKKRRVIRTSVVYIALVWVALQVADLLAGAQIISEDLVRWLIFSGLVGFPVVVALSWFFETPWRDRRWLSVAGDVGVILAIAVAVFLLAWQQWFTSFTRTTIAITRIEPTDTRQDTRWLADHFAVRLRMLLATRAEIRVVELASSQAAGLENMSPASRADLLGAEFIISGTLNQGDGDIRLSIQLYSSDGALVFSEQFVDRLLDQSQLESRVLNALWPSLPLPPNSLTVVREFIMSCKYPADPDAIRAIARMGSRLGDISTPVNETEQMTHLIERFQDNGLLHLARAKAFFAALKQAPASRRSVLQSMAMQDLTRALDQCPGLPEAEALRLYHTLQLQAADSDQQYYLSHFPNDSRLRRELAAYRANVDDLTGARLLAGEAYTLNPLNAEAFCFYRQILIDEDSKAARGKLLSLEHRTVLPDSDPDSDPDPDFDLLCNGQ